MIQLRNPARFKLNCNNWIYSPSICMHDRRNDISKEINEFFKKAYRCCESSKMCQCINHSIFGSVKREDILEMINCNHREIFDERLLQDIPTEQRVIDDMHDNEVILYDDDIIMTSAWPFGVAKFYRVVSTKKGYMLRIYVNDGQSDHTYEIILISLRSLCMLSDWREVDYPAQSSFIGNYNDSPRLWDRFFEMQSDLINRDYYSSQRIFGDKEIL